MSDFSIPGVKSKYDTQKLIDDLMKLERVPRTRAVERQDTLKLQKTVWQDIGRRMSSLRESARNLYSFQSPFNARSATSSDSSALTASADRNAIEETKSIEITQTASADRFMSDPLPKDYRIAAGEYRFTLGDKSLAINFAGGSIADFVAALNRRGVDQLRAQAINVTKDSQVLVIESLRTGSAVRLGFEGQAEKLGLDAGFFVRGQSSTREFDVSKPVRFENPMDNTKVLLSSGHLHINAGGEAALKLGSPVATSGLVLELQVQLIAREEPEAPSAPPGPSFPATGLVDYEGIRIESAPSQAILPDLSIPPPPPRKDSTQLLYLIGGAGQALALAPLKDSKDTITLTIPLAAYTDTVAGLGFKNENTHKDLVISGARVYNPDELGDFKPKNPIETARDAVLVMDGIKITRSTNSIDDLIPGVTLNAIKPTKEKVTLTISPDREASKEAIIELVGRYNRLMAEINILARSEPSILEEISYFTEEERKTQRERLGLFQGDSTLSSIRTNLQRINSDPYETSQGLSLLASMGISTNATGTYDASRLRGYLEIDEKVLDKALADRFAQLKEIFGFDSDKDLLVDSGVAFKLENLTKAYVETGGILATKNSTMDGQLKRVEQEIASLDKQLERKEADLKRKYGLMEGVMSQMESSSSAWENFSKQNE
jgi:flagellar hook-associated protein 2